MPRTTTYHSRETVKARKVTNKDGEDVVTSRGAVHAAKGDYVVEHDDGITVQQGAEFEARYKAPSTPKKRAQSASKTPAKPSAAERVKAAQNGS